MKISDVLKGKSGGIVSITSGSSLLSGMQLMCEKKVGSVMVETDTGELQGILTERDILHHCTEQQGDIANATVNDAMTKHLIITTMDTSVEDAMKMMTQHRFRHLPVIENNKPVAIVSIGDLVKARLQDMSVEVKYLRDYINA